MLNETAGENQESNQENDGQMIKRLREERNTYKAQKAHWKKKAEARGEEKPKAEAPKEKSDEPDYSKIAYLNSVNVKHSDDQKLVMDEAKRLKLPLTDILAMKHIKTKLKDIHDQREAKDGSPKGKGKHGSSSQTNVDYWLAKGEAPDDPELRAKYFEAREKQESNANQFSNDLYTIGGKTKSKE
jgi:hypothetical protein